MGKDHAVMRAAKAVIAETKVLLGEASEALEEGKYIYAEALIDRAQNCLREQDVFGDLAAAHLIRLQHRAGQET